MNNAKVDLLSPNGQAKGQVANQINSIGRLNPNRMRPFVGDDGRAYISAHTGGDVNDPENYENHPIQANATLRRDEWKQLDEAVLKIKRQRLGGIQDLEDNDLVFDLGNAMGTTVFEYHDMSDAMEAELSMDGLTRGQNDRPEFTTNYLPLPIIHVDYQINARVLENSRRLGQPLDTASAELATRKVNEKLEKLLFTDTTYSFGGGTMYSFVNYSDRNQVSLSGRPGGAWDNSAKTGEQIVNDVVNLKKTAIADNFYGPFRLYIPTSYETVLDKDYDSTTPGTTIRERINKISGIDGIKTIDTLPADNVLLVQMSTDVVRLIRGMGIENIEWKEQGRFVNKYKVITIQAPQIRSDQEGHCGIVHMA